ncbi:BED zinc finger, partial [Prunus dulcis]
GAQPRFDLPSHTTIARDVWDLYQEEKAKIKSVLTHNAQRVSLTTDTWTSIQNINYMVLMAYFIDDDWVWHKRILNFCVIPNHKGNTTGRLVKACLNGWGIDKVFTISVDNASSNDGCISYMKKRLEKWNSLIGDGGAHITNLIVTDGMKEIHQSIESIRNCAKYVWGSSQLLEKFRACLEMEKVDTRTMVPLDRQKGFERMEEDGPKFLEYFEEYEADGKERKKRVGPPTSLNWDNTKFDKYWGNVNNINKLFFVTVILNPRYKMEYVEFCLDDLVSDENGVNEMSLEIKTLLHNLYDYYRKQNPAAAQVFHGNVESEGSLHVNNDVTKSSRRYKDVVEIRNKIDKYLLEPPVNLTNDEFKLLDWWKENATKFPILSNVAKYVFAVQASTVASECFFSTGKRVVDPFRGSLTPKIIEALICCSDWLRKCKFELNMKQLMELYYLNDENFRYLELEKLEKLYRNCPNLNC